MISHPYIDLIQKLLYRTQEGNVNWEETSDESTYVAYFQTSSLSLRRSYADHDGEEFIVFTLMDSEGKDMDSFSISEHEKYWQEISELHAAARRKARKIDKTIKEILSELDNKNSIEKEDDDLPF